MNSLHSLLFSNILFLLLLPYTWPSREFQTNGFYFQFAEKIFREEKTLFVRQPLNFQTIFFTLQKLDEASNNFLTQCMKSAKPVFHPLMMESILDVEPISNGPTMLVLLRKKVTLNQAHLDCQKTGGQIFEPISSPIRESAVSLLIRHNLEHTFVNADFDTPTLEWKFFPSKTPVPYIFPTIDWCLYQPWNSSNPCRENSFTRTMDEFRDDFYRTLLFSTDSNIHLYNPFKRNSSFFGGRYSSNWKFRTFEEEYFDYYGNQPDYQKMPLSTWRDVYPERPAFMQPLCIVHESVYKPAVFNSDRCTDTHGVLKTIRDDAFLLYSKSLLSKFIAVSSLGKPSSNNFSTPESSFHNLLAFPFGNNSAFSFVTNSSDQLPPFVPKQSTTNAVLKDFYSEVFDALSPTESTILAVKRSLDSTEMAFYLNSLKMKLALTLQEIEEILNAAIQGHLHSSLFFHHKLLDFATSRGFVEKPSSSFRPIRLVLHFFKSNCSLEMFYAVPCAASPFTVANIIPLPSIRHQVIPKISHSLIAHDSKNKVYFPLSEKLLDNVKGEYLPPADLTLYSIQASTCGWSVLSYKDTVCNYSFFHLPIFLHTVKNGLLFSAQHESVSYNCEGSVSPTTLTLDESGILHGHPSCSLTIGNLGISYHFSGSSPLAVFNLDQFQPIIIPQKAIQQAASLQYLESKHNDLHGAVEGLSDTVSASFSGQSIFLIILSSLLLLFLLLFLLYHFKVIRSPLTYVDHLRSTWGQDLTFRHAGPSPAPSSVERGQADQHSFRPPQTWSP